MAQTSNTVYSNTFANIDGNDNSVKFAKKLGFKINQKTPISVIEKTTYPILEREHLIE